jgi:hypothetical protein
MTFDILPHLDQLKPDGGANVPHGDHSFHCPACGSSNFKVNVTSAKWSCFGCDCSSSEEGKRRIRNALSPVTNQYPIAPPGKSIRPQARRSWIYPDAEGKPILEVHRTDDGNGKRKIWQTSLIEDKRPKDLLDLVVPNGLRDAQQALEDGEPYVFIPEGEPCADALRQLGLTAVATLGGCEGFNPKRDGGHFDPTRVVVVPDQDRSGLKFARKVAEAYPGCSWLLPYPGTPGWNGAMPNDGGLDVADWIADGANVEAILNGVRRDNPFSLPAQVIDPFLSPLEQWEQLLANLVDPEHCSYERNVVRRQIRAATAANQLRLRVTPDQVRQRLQQKQRDRIADSSIKGVGGGEVVPCVARKFLINGVIPEGCLTGIAAKAKTGKTVCLTEITASLVFGTAFMGNPEWMPAPGHHKLILWWTDQPRVDSVQYLRARGLIDAKGKLHPQILRLYSEEDGLDWGDQGIDELIRITTANPGAILLSDSFYSNVRGVFGDDQDPGAGGALIDVQSTIGQSVRGHICAFHSPQDGNLLGAGAVRGHGSAKGVPSAIISLHFLEKRSPNGKWGEDKENPHRRMVMEGRMGYWDLLVRLHGSQARWEVIGPFEKSLANLQADDSKAETIEHLTEGQRKTLEWVGGAMGLWKDPRGVTAAQVANAMLKDSNRAATPAEVQTTRKQLNALHKLELLTKQKVSNVDYFRFRG